MTDETTPTTDTTQTTPATPLDPAMTTMKVVPPIVPLSTWTWNSPVIPTFYWNVYSAEQRIRQICMEIGRIEAYLDYFGAYANRAHGELNKRIDVLTAKLTEEVNRLDKRIDEENEARKAADELLQKGLDAETARAKAAEQVLQTNIDTVQSNLDNEATIRKNADDKLTADLNTETAARAAGDKLLQEHLDAETTRAKNAEKANADAIATETTNREQADTALGNRITDETEDRKNGDTALGNRVDAVDARVTQEVTDRTQADARLEGKIDANTANITANADAISKETERAKAAEAANTSLINANKTAADEADKRIQDSLDTEIANRKNSDNTLTESIANETKSRQDADKDITSRLDGEAKTRADADTALTKSVNQRVIPTNVKAAEGSHLTVTTAVSEDDPNGTTVTLGDTFDADFTALDTKVTDLEGKLTHETNDRETADNTLTEAVNKRLTAEKVLAGDNITVTPDPDATTVTIAAKVPDVSQKLESVEHDYTLNGSGTSADPLAVNVHNNIAQTNENVVYVRPTSTGALSIKAGDGLTAYNVDSDPDQGSGIRLSDHVNQLLEDSENALQEVHHDGTLEGTGTSSTPLKVKAFNGIVTSKLVKNSYGELGIEDVTASNDGVGVVKVVHANAYESFKYSDDTTIASTGGQGVLGVRLAQQNHPGVVQPDGTTTTVDADGTIHAVASGTTGIEKVTVDDTLTGDGTSAHPLGVSETIVANSTAGSTALQTVHHDDTLTGTGTDTDPLKVVGTVKQVFVESTSAAPIGTVAAFANNDVNSVFPSIAMVSIVTVKAYQNVIGGTVRLSQGESSFSGRIIYQYSDNAFAVSTGKFADTETTPTISSMTLYTF